MRSLLRHLEEVCDLARDTVVEGAGEAKAVAEAEATTPPAPELQPANV